MADTSLLDSLRAPKAEEPPPFEAPRRGRPPKTVGPAVRPPPILDGPAPDKSSVTAAWQGAWMILSFMAGFWGYELEPLPREEAEEDAKVLLPVVTRFPALARAMTWLGAPIVLFRRLTQHAKKKPKNPAPSSTKPGTVTPIREPVGGPAA
jgi:hypothetical protein